MEICTKQDKYESSLFYLNITDGVILFFIPYIFSKSIFRLIFVLISVFHIEHREISYVLLLL